MNLFLAGMAQLVEYLPMDRKVTGLTPDRAHTQVACLILNWVCKRGNRSMFFPLSLSLPLPLSLKQTNNKTLKID